MVRYGPGRSPRWHWNHWQRSVSGILVIHWIDFLGSSNRQRIKKNWIKDAVLRDVLISDSVKIGECQCHQLSWVWIVQVWNWTTERSKDIFVDSLIYTATLIVEHAWVTRALSYQTAVQVVIIWTITEGIGERAGTWVGSLIWIWLSDNIGHQFHSNVQVMIVFASSCFRWVTNSPHYWWIVDGFPFKSATRKSNCESNRVKTLMCGYELITT
jgi:hypothetical protein